MRLCLTVDVDWAPDFAIGWMAERIRKAAMPATWFVTHDSTALRSLAADPTQEIGIHPNLFPDSTQGGNMEEIVGRLLALCPGARGVRSHALLDSTRHQRYYVQAGLKYMSNVIAWRKPSAPSFLHWSGIWQIPISWEDDVACSGTDEPVPALPPSDEDSLWVMTFHPLYCYLNEGAGMKHYGEVKRLSPGPITALARDLIDPLVAPGFGIGRIFDDVLRRAREHTCETLGSVYAKLSAKHAANG